MNNQEGHYTWVIPDGWLPPKGGNGDMPNHESLMVLNTGRDRAQIKLDIYFDDSVPFKGIALCVEGERIKAFRMDNPENLGGFELPRAKQYALRIRSNVKIIVQFGRMDVRQANLAYYGTMAYPVN